MDFEQLDKESKRLFKNRECLLKNLKKLDYLIHQNKLLKKKISEEISRICAIIF